MILNDYYVILYAYDIPKYFKEYDYTMSKTSTVHIHYLTLVSMTAASKPSFCVALDYGIYKTALNVYNKVMTSADVIICQICY